MSEEKVVPLEQLGAIVAGLRREGHSIVTTNGCFDLLHLGHVRYLEEAAKHGEVLVVGINSDNSVRQLKGPSRPIVPEAERAALVAALEAVDYVTIFDRLNPNELVALLRPDVHVKGRDYDPKRMPETVPVRQWGGRVVTVELSEGHSTSELIRRIRGLDDASGGKPEPRGPKPRGVDDGE